MEIKFLPCVFVLGIHDNDYRICTQHLVPGRQGNASYYSKNLGFIE